MLCGQIQGQTTEAACVLSERLESALFDASPPDASLKSELGELQALLGTREAPSRRHCAALAARALRSALDSKS